MDLPLVGLGEGVGVGFMLFPNTAVNQPGVSGPRLMDDGDLFFAPPMASDGQRHDR